MLTVRRLLQHAAVVTVAFLVCAPEARAQAGAEILKAAGVSGGLVVHVGCGDGSVTAGLRANDGLLVHGLEPDAGRVAAARAHIRGRGLYGPVSLEHWPREFLPYADGLVKLVVGCGGPVISAIVSSALTPLVYVVAVWRVFPQSAIV